MSGPTLLWQMYGSYTFLLRWEAFMEPNVVPILFSSCARDPGLFKACGCAFMRPRMTMQKSLLQTFFFDLLALNKYF